MTRVKICGFTRADDVDAALDAGADFLGFNLWRGSSRRLEPSDARALIARIPAGRAIPVAVFVHGESWALDCAEFTRAAWVQLHGAAPAWTPARVTRPVVRAVAVEGRPLATADLAPADYWLLDAAQRGHGGGGKTFDWENAAALAGHPRLFVAGGLTPENVAEVVRRLKPYAVDVASGVESSPGVKDRGKMKAFIEAVRGADQT